MSEPTQPSQDELKSDLKFEIEAMERHRRRVAHARTPEEHMAIVDRLQRESMDAIFSDPAAYEAFMARNHRKRRKDVVDRLEAKILGRDTSEPEDE